MHLMSPAMAAAAAIAGCLVDVRAYMPESTAHIARIGSAMHPETAPELRVLT